MKIEVFNKKRYLQIRFEAFLFAPSWLTEGSFSPESSFEASRSKFCKSLSVLCLNFFDFFREHMFLTLGLNAQQREDSGVAKFIENLRVLDVVL